MPVNMPATPQLILGTWSSRVNKYGVIFSMVVTLFVFVLISPFLFKSIVVGSGLTAKIGLASAFVTVPMGFFLTIVGSLIPERIPSFAQQIPREETQRFIERIHGWPEYTGTRYAGTGLLLIIALLCIPTFIWGVMPWPK